MLEILITQFEMVSKLQKGQLLVGKVGKIYGVKFEIAMATGVWYYHQEKLIFATLTSVQKLIEVL